MIFLFVPMKNLRIFFIIFVILSIISTSTYYYFNMIVPNLENLTSNWQKDKKLDLIKFRRISPVLWPWFGIRLEQVSFSNNGELKWQAPKIELELSLKSAALAENRINHIRIYNPRIELKTKLINWQKQLNETSLPETIGFPAILTNRSLEVEISHANFKLKETELIDVNAHASRIQKDNPFTLSINGSWQQHPFDFSVLITDYPKIIKFDNMHLSLNEMAKKYGMSNVKINSDAYYNKERNKLVLNNLVLMTPEARLQGKIGVELSEELASHGNIILPAAPCRQILDDLNLRLGADKDFLARCSAQADWQDNNLNFTLSTVDFKAVGKMLLNDPKSEKNEIKLLGGNINILKPVKSGEVSISDRLDAWFSKLEWRDTYLNNLPVNIVACKKQGYITNCKLNDNIITRLKGNHSGHLALRRLSPKEIMQATGKNPEIDIEGEISGYYSWRVDSGITTYSGSLDSNKIVLNNIDIKSALKHNALSQNLIIKKGGVNTWKKFRLEFQGLNDITRINYLKLVANDSNISASGILDLGSGVYSIELLSRVKRYNLIGKWPENIRLLLSQSSPGRI